MKRHGYDILITKLAKEHCPNEFGFEDSLRENIAETKECIYGDGNHQGKCEYCWLKSLNREYQEDPINLITFEELREKWEGKTIAFDEFDEVWGYIPEEITEKYEFEFEALGSSEEHEGCSKRCCYMKGEGDEKDSSLAVCESFEFYTRD